MNIPTPQYLTAMLNMTDEGRQFVVVVESVMNDMVYMAKARHLVPGATMFHVVNVRLPEIDHGHFKSLMAHFGWIVINVVPQGITTEVVLRESFAYMIQ
jgi:hypothetical protein